MEKTLENFSLSLFIWQIIMLVLLIAAVYFIVKLYSKLMKYLDRNNETKKPNRF